MGELYSERRCVDTVKLDRSRVGGEEPVCESVALPYRIAQSTRLMVFGSPMPRSIPPTQTPRMVAQVPGIVLHCDRAEFPEDDAHDGSGPVRKLANTAGAPQVRFTHMLG